MKVLEGLPADVPVFFAPSIDHYVLTRYADIEAVCLDPVTFSSASAQVPLVQLTPTVEAMLLEDGRPPAPSLLSLDPPAHSRLRTPVARALSPRRITSMEPVIRECARRLLDRVRGQVLFDVVRALACPLPAEVIFSLIGVPPEDWERLLVWSAHRSALVWGRPSPADQVTHAESVIAYRAYLRDLVASKVARADGDLTEALLALGRDEAAALSRAEIGSILYSLTFAGHQTTNYLIGNLVRRLLTDADLWAGVVAGEASIAAALEEVVRHDPPVPTLQRVTTKATLVHGVRIPAGAKVLLWVAAAGRDSIVFRDASSWDLSRSNASRSLGFGRGIHYCVGAALGRLEARIAVEELSTTFPRLALLPGQSLEPEPNLSFRGVQELWVITQS